MNNWIERNAHDGLALVCPFCGRDFGVLVEDSNYYKFCPHCGKRVITADLSVSNDTKFIANCMEMIDWADANSYDVPIGLSDTLNYAYDRVKFDMEHNFYTYTKGV